MEKPVKRIGFCAKSGTARVMLQALAVVISRSVILKDGVSGEDVARALMAFLRVPNVQKPLAAAKLMKALWDFEYERCPSIEFKDFMVTIRFDTLTLCVQGVPEAKHWSVQVEFEDPHKHPAIATHWKKVGLNFIMMKQAHVFQGNYMN